MRSCNLWDAQLLMTIQRKLKGHVVNSPINNQALTLVVLWVDLGWLPGAHQDTLSLPLLNRTGGKNTTNSSWVRIRTGRLPITITGKTDST